MNNKCLKDKVNKNIDDLNNDLDNLESIIVDELDENVEKLAICDLYKQINKIRNILCDLDDNFSDFEKEVDDIHSTISDLLGKVGN